MIVYGRVTRGFTLILKASERKPYKKRSYKQPQDRERLIQPKEFSTAFQNGVIYAAILFN